MILGVMSDSHGETAHVRRAAEQMLSLGVELIIHLGDDYDDASVLPGDKVRVIKVPGVFSAYYKDPAIPNRLVMQLNGIRVLVSHTHLSHANDLPSDPKPERLIADRAIDVVLYGHTHVYDIREESDIVFVNPGHLKREDRKGRRPSFASIDITGRRLESRIYDLNGNEVLHHTKVFT
jgi:putative phosphoesterase